MAGPESIIKLAPLESAAADLERVSRVTTAWFIGFAATQLIFAALYATGAVTAEDYGVPDTGDFAISALGGFVLWFFVGGVLILAVNSGPRWVAALASLLLAGLFLAITAASIGAAIALLYLAAQAGDLAPTPLWDFLIPAPAVIGAGFALCLFAIWISLETLLVSGRAFICALSQPDEKIRLARGLRGAGPLSFAGLLATFDLPIVIRERGAGAGKIAAIIGIVFATLGACLWLAIPLNILFAAVMVAGQCDESGADTAASMALCFLPQSGELVVSLIVFSLGALMLCLIGAGVLSLSKRLLARGLARDKDGAPIVFLRSFENDTARVRPPRRGLLGTLLDLGRTPDGMDQILVYEFARHGPVMALGKPGEKRPPFGATRLYVEHATWQADISAQIEKALASVLVVDKGEGLGWEIEQSLRRPRWREHTLFILPQKGDLARLQALAPDIAPPETKDHVVGAAASNEGWRFYITKRPTRIAYQAMARHYFAGLTG